MSEMSRVIAIIPCNDLDASESFYNKLGFKRKGWDEEYRIMFDGEGAEIHLTRAVKGWLTKGRNPFGIYYNTKRVEELAKNFGKKVEDEPWSMYEFSVSDPDETLVRVGWPSELMREAAANLDTESTTVN